MLQTLQKIELLSLSLSHGVLTSVGAVLLCAGLCVWLGGLRWMVLSGVLSGAFAGVALASFTPADFQTKAFFIAAVAVGCFVMLLRKRSLVFIAALIVVFSGLFISVLPAMNESGGWQISEIPEKAEGIERISAGDTFSVLCKELFSFCGAIGSHIKQISIGPIIISSSVAFTMLGVGMFFPRIVSSIGSSMLGTLFIFAGMIALLLQKGSMPFSGIYEKTIFYQTIIVCMIMFGSVCGLLLCPIRRATPVFDKKDKEKRNEFI